jgi:hypothetical protein
MAQKGRMGLEARPRSFPFFSVKSHTKIHYATKQDSRTYFDFFKNKCFEITLET